MTEQQFMNMVYPEPNTGCWLWSGRHDKNGYGRGHFLNRTIQLTHRYSYYLMNGHFDLSKCVLHHCDNPACVNPDHLYIGDMAQNCKDRDSRGRQKTKRGSEHKLAKITEQDSIDIRKLHLVDGIGQRQVARIYNISQRKVLDIVKNRSWKHTL